MTPSGGPASVLPEGSPRSRSAELGSVEFVWQASREIGVVCRTVGAGGARSGKLAQGRDTLGPAAAPRLPQLRADERLRAMLERLLDRDHDHRRRFLAVDREAALEGRIGADPASPVDPVGLVRSGDEKDQPDA